MNSLLRTLTLVSAFALTHLAHAASDAQPQYLDFSDVAPAAHGQFVEVDVDEAMLSLAAKFADVREKEAAEVLRGLKSVRVRVISLDDANRQTVMQRIHAARTGLADDGWKRLAVARDGKGQDVAVFARIQGSDAIQGLAVTVIDGDREAIVVNVVGDIKPEQISALGVRFGIDPLKEMSIAGK